MGNNNWFRLEVYYKDGRSEVHTLQWSEAWGKMQSLGATRPLDVQLLKMVDLGADWKNPLSQPVSENIFNVK